MAATCGNCKSSNQTVAHIRACYAARNEFGAGYRVKIEVPGHEQKNYPSRVDVAAPKRPTAISNEWAEVNQLREEIRPYLAAKPSGDRIGYFAINVADGFGGAPVKFYRVKAKGRYVFIDAQASDEYHSVRSPQSLKLVLRAILVDPRKASERYADELGRCYRCGRTLTDETSRSIGMGPECRSK